MFAGSRMKSKRRWAAALLLLACYWFSLGARAQDAGTEAARKDAASDAVMAKLLAAERGQPNGRGMVIIDAGFEQKMGCVGRQVGVGRPVNGKLVETPIRGMSRFFGALTNVVPRTVLASELYVVSATCEMRFGGSGRQIFNGPHARFHVRPGEVVDAGMLNVQYESTNFFLRTGNLRVSVGNTSEERLSGLKKRFPLLMRNYVKRPMILLRPDERKALQGGQS
jgi:hypothetical protein